MSPFTGPLRRLLGLQLLHLRRGPGLLLPVRGLRLAVGPALSELRQRPTGMHSGRRGRERRRGRFLDHGRRRLLRHRRSGLPRSGEPPGAGVRQVSGRLPPLGQPWRRRGGIDGRLEITTLEAIGVLDVTRVCRLHTDGLRRDAHDDGGQVLQL